jgi:hypothetical protein
MIKQNPIPGNIPGQLAGCKVSQQFHVMCCKRIWIGKFVVALKFLTERDMIDTTRVFKVKLTQEPVRPVAKSFFKWFSSSVHICDYVLLTESWLNANMKSVELKTSSHLQGQQLG